MVNELKDKVVHCDYAYVMLKSCKSDTSQVILSKSKLKPMDVITLMLKNGADIGCDVYFTNRGIENWTHISFFSGLLGDVDLKAKK